MQMVSVNEATELIIENCNNPHVEQLPLPEATGLILAETVYSTIDTPPFNQSAMDGYAFSYDDWDGVSSLSIISEVQAGNLSLEVLNPLEAIRIFTGAPLPLGADTVIMQEKVFVKEKSLTINDLNFVKGCSVRLKGSQTKKGEDVLREGQLLTPAAISFLAGLGILNVKIYSKPNISIIATGSELIKPGSNISDGKIFESNSYGLTAALNQIAISPVFVDVVVDDEKKIIESISKQLHSDIIILTGGVSVGDYDFVEKALEKCGVRKIFHGVKQKPGKPFYFGKYNQTLVFALPGNPAAALTCFYGYIVPAISNFTKIKYFNFLELPLMENFRKKPGLTFFLKGKTSDNVVSVLENQESYMMNSFALADCLVELDEEREFYKKGDLVNVKMIV